MKNLIFLFAITAAAFSSTAPTARAQWDVGGFDPLPLPGPIIDVDFELWGRNPRPLWVWDVVVIGDDGPEVVSSGHRTERDANYRLFRMIEWGLIDLSADVEVVRRNDRQFEFMSVYETQDRADAAANFLRAFRWEAEVRMVWVIDWP
ncbi:MAG: hypothetical protein AB8G99_19245 [Planctomycetaceae bacterium]